MTANRQKFSAPMIPYVHRNDHLLQRWVFQESFKRVRGEQLKGFDKNEYVQPGIHAILPIHSQQPHYEWNNIIYIFYWSLLRSFDMNKMKEVKNMRTDPSCLLTRILV